MGFHLMPIPVDPYALPTARNSDPLRGPIFVPLSHPLLDEATDEVLMKFMHYLIVP